MRVILSGAKRSRTAQQCEADAEQDLIFDLPMYYVYILTNKNNKVIYVGVTNSLRRRLYEHKSEQIEGFTKKYHLHKLVYFEEYSDINDAIAREKQIKRWKRAKKNWLVETLNPNWIDWGEKFI